MSGTEEKAERSRDAWQVLRIFGVSLGVVFILLVGFFVFAWFYGPYCEWTGDCLICGATVKYRKVAWFEWTTVIPSPASAWHDRLIPGAHHHSYNVTDWTTERTDWFEEMDSFPPGDGTIQPMEMLYDYSLTHGDAATLPILKEYDRNARISDEEGGGFYHEWLDSQVNATEPSPIPSSAPEGH